MPQAMPQRLEEKELQLELVVMAVVVQQVQRVEHLVVLQVFLKTAEQLTRVDWSETILQTE
jgi:hypothetical protein